MKKLLAIGVVLGFAVTGLVGMPAKADQRLGLSTSSNLVFLGTTVNLFPNVGSLGDLSSSDFETFRYEISVGKGESASAEVTYRQLKSSECSGDAISIDVNYQYCVEPLSRNKQVFDASARINQAGGSYLWLKPTGGKATNYKIRVWFDLNRNNRIDSFEPASAVSLVQALDPAQARGYVSFNVEPPLITESKLVSYLNFNATVGTGAGSIGMLNPTLVQAQLQVCGEESPCELTDLSLTYRSHPQLQRYEFKSDLNVSQGRKYTVVLYYQPYPVENPEAIYILGSRTIDYRGIEVVDAEASIWSARIASLGVDQVESILEDDQAPTIVDSVTQVVRYQALLRDNAGNPVANQQSYLRIDLKGLSERSNLKIDSVNYSACCVDEFYIARTSDEKGMVTAEVQVNPQRLGSSLGIELISGGYRGKFISDKALEQVVLWGADSTRVINLRLATSTASGGDPIRFEVSSTRPDGSVQNGESLIIDADENLVIENTKVSSGGSSLAVSVSPLAPKSGKGLVTVSALNQGEIIRRSLEVNWIDYGVYVTAKLIKERTVPKIISVSSRTNVKPGQTVSVDVSLSDFYRDLANHKIQVSIEGPGKLLPGLRTSDLFGRVPLKIAFGPKESGVAKIKVSVAGSRVVSTHYILVGVKAKLKRVGQHLQVTIENASNSEVSVMTGSKTTLRLPKSKVSEFKVWDLPRTSTPVTVAVYGIEVLKKTMSFANQVIEPSAGAAWSISKKALEVSLTGLANRRVKVLIDGEVVRTHRVKGNSQIISLKRLKSGPAVVTVMLGDKVLYSESLTLG